MFWVGYDVYWYLAFEKTSTPSDLLTWKVKQWIPFLGYSVLQKNAWYKYLMDSVSHFTYKVNLEKHVKFFNKH